MPLSMVKISYVLQIEVKTQVFRKVVSCRMVSSWVIQNGIGICRVRVCLFARELGAYLPM